MRNRAWAGRRHRGLSPLVGRPAGKNAAAPDKPSLTPRLACRVLEDASQGRRLADAAAPRRARRPLALADRLPLLLLALTLLLLLCPRRRPAALATGCRLLPCPSPLLWRQALQPLEPRCQRLLVLAVLFCPRHNRWGGGGGCLRWCRGCRLLHLLRLRRRWLRRLRANLGQQSVQPRHYPRGPPRRRLRGMWRQRTGLRPCRSRRLVVIACLLGLLRLLGLLCRWRRRYARMLILEAWRWCQLHSNPTPQLLVLGGQQ